MQFWKTVLSRISTGTAPMLATAGASGTPSLALFIPSTRSGLPTAGIARRTGLDRLGHKGRQVCRFGRQNRLYGLHCDRDTARLVSLFAKGAVRPVGRLDA